MRALTVLHRWFGVAFCLLFAMWFASGAIMHWLPFPELTENERVAGLNPITGDGVKLSPSQALAALKSDAVLRLRLAAPGDRAVYIATLVDGTQRAVDAASGNALVIDETFALASARAHAAARGLIKIAPALSEKAGYDQWTVSNGLDAHRPLFHIALNDAAGSELYVSSTTGEVVRDATRVERIINYAGSIVHWIYPTVLRQHWAVWDATVWWLSLIAMLGAIAGALLGMTRLRNFSSPFRGWMYWHHVLGLACATFVLTWIVSGWLSMDHGRIFADGRINGEEQVKLIGAPLTTNELTAVPRPPAPVREMEWFRFGGSVLAQSLRHDDLERAAARLGDHCSIGSDEDAYAAHSRVAGAIVYRIVCGATWYQIDGADGRIIEKLDPSRRAYRWAFRALHTLDFPLLVQIPALRDALIILLCVGGFGFSLTGVVIGWRRIKTSTGVV